MNSKKIFISHISKETDLAQSLKVNLVKDFLGMLEIFVSSDENSIKLGEKWLDEVDEALDEAGILIVLCSKESVIRPWVNFEAGAAWIRKIPVIPICHSGFSPNDLPTPLSMLQGTSADEQGLKKLYLKISEYLKVNVPEANFKKIAENLKEIERSYINETPKLESITNPRILCAASKFYSTHEMGFHLDVKVLKNAFPGCVQVEKNLTRKSLLQLLANDQFDILHLVVGVDKETGDLVFSEMDDLREKPIAFGKELMSADGFAGLLQESNTKLVVLATCNALLLAVEVARFANMAASEANITGLQAEEWADCFYGLLADGKTLYKAFEITRTQLENIPIRAIRHRNMTFVLEQGKVGKDT